jgi:DEAD/DEAH box helicase domain-containing protein
MNIIFFDIETRNIFSDVGKADPTLLDISVVCTYESTSGEYKSFLQEDLPQLWPIIEKADMLVTFNGDHFDIPLLNKYYSGDLTKIRSLDLLKEVRKSLGFRVGLGNIAEATLGHGKSGHGLEAVEWWKKGEIDKIIKYCIEDVKVTKEIFDYAVANKTLKYKEGGVGNPIPFAIDTTGWTEMVESKLTFSLPF